MIKVPINLGVKLYVYQCPKRHEEEEYMPQVSYVSCLVLVCTRTKIGHAMGVFISYMSKLGKKHWKIVKRVFRYLCATT